MTTQYKKNPVLLLKSKEGKLRLEINEAIPAGSVVFLNKPEEQAEFKLKNGYITEEQAQQFVEDHLADGNKSFIRAYGSKPRPQTSK